MPTFLPNRMSPSKATFKSRRLPWIISGPSPNDTNFPYRVFFTDVTLEIQNFSNHLRDGVARGKAKAKFMGSGPTEIEFAFRPENKGPDSDLKVRIENTDMRTMNDLCRAYGNFDVA